MTEAPPDERRTKPFADVLTTLQRGKTHRELSSGLQQLTEAVVETGRGGTITLQLKISKSKATGMIEVTDKVAVKLPEADRAASLFYVSDDHNLERDNPHQDTLPGIVRRVPDGEGEQQAAGESR